MSIQPNVGKLPLPPKPPLLPKPKNIGLLSNSKPVRKITSSQSFQSIKHSVVENGTSHQLTRSQSATVSSSSISDESSISVIEKTGCEVSFSSNTQLTCTYQRKDEVVENCYKVVNTEDLLNSSGSFVSPNKSFLHSFNDQSDTASGDSSLPITINIALSSTPKTDFLTEVEYSSLSECGWSETNSISSDSIEDGGVVKKRFSALINYFRNDKDDKGEAFFYDEDYSEDARSSSLVHGDNINDNNSELPESTACDNSLLFNSGQENGSKELHGNIKDKQFLIAQELMTSEEVYVDALRLIVHDFVSHIEQFGKDLGAPVIQKTDLDRIINTLPQLLLLNEHLLCDLKSRIADWNSLKKIADVIAKNGPFLKLYINYMKNFEFQSQFLDECCQKYPRFSKALKEFESSERCKKLTLKHYMLKPVQRIPQYRLLLEDYQRHLDKDSPDFKNTSEALSVVHNVLHLANSSMKDSDRLSKLLEVQAALGNYEIIKPGRDFLKEGDLYKLSRKELQLRHFILLSDCLLYTTYLTSVSGLRVKYELPLSGMKLSKRPCDPTEFSIITSTRSFTLKARSEEEQIEWTNALQDAISENKHKQLSFLNSKCLTKSYDSEPLKFGKEAPVWVQDKQATMCQVCTAEFTVTFRRHHCRCCGKVVCGVCSNNKAPLQYLKFESARVCEECYEILFQEFEDSASMIEAVRSELNVSVEEAASTHNILRYSFKKYDANKKPKKYVPQRLKEVTANDKDSLVSGWLFKKTKRGWKRNWYVLKDQVMYAYKASQDVVAHDTIPVLGYTIDRPSEDQCEEMDSALVFTLNHRGQTPLVFAGNNKATVDKWVSALSAEVVLK